MMRRGPGSRALAVQPGPSGAPGQRPA